MDKISKIKQLMNESKERFYSVEQLCEKMEVPYHTFRKLFRRTEGVNLSEFLQQCRLQKAEQLLSNRDNCVYEVADTMRFSSDGNSSRWFKKQKGMTPTEFQNQVQQNPE